MCFSALFKRLGITLSCLVVVLSGCKHGPLTPRYRDFVGPLTHVVEPNGTGVTCQLSTPTGAIPPTGPKIEIMARAGSIVLQSDEAGKLTFPWSDGLLKENPPVHKLYQGRLNYQITFTASGVTDQSASTSLSVLGKPLVEGIGGRVWHPPDAVAAAEDALAKLEAQAQYIQDQLGLAPVPWGLNLISERPADTHIVTAQDHLGWSIWSYSTDQVRTGEFAWVNVHEWTEATLEAHLQLADADKARRNRVWVDGLAEYMAARFTGRLEATYGHPLEELLAEGQTVINLPAAFRSMRASGTGDLDFKKLLRQGGFPPGYALSYSFWERLCSEYGRELPGQFVGRLRKEQKRDFATCTRILEQLAPGARVQTRLRRLSVADALTLILAQPVSTPESATQPK